MTPRNTVIVGDALTQLEMLADSSVDSVITSPPYYQLRDYGVDGQLGLEATVEDWVNQIRAVCSELGRVLVPTGSLWLNLGDSFSRHPRYGARTKSLLLAPERVVLRLIEDGWLVRTKAVWHKPNAMPTSVRDRLSLTYEVVYHLVRQRMYYFDLDAIREPHRSSEVKRSRRPRHEPAPWTGPLAASRGGLTAPRPAGPPGHPLGRNPGDVWSIATRGYSGHHAVFPPQLVRRPILATCPLAACTNCGRGVTSTAEQPDCSCQAPLRPGLVLDPFFGTGTVGAAAQEHGRDFLGIELNAAYAALARRRLGLSEPRDDEPRGQALHGRASPEEPPA